MSYCCCYGLISNLDAILSHKIFNKLANLNSFCLDHMTPHVCLDTPWKSYSWFLPLDSKYQEILQKWAKHLDRECVLKIEALTQVAKYWNTYLCHKQDTGSMSRQAEYSGGFFVLLKKAMIHMHPMQFVFIVQWHIRAIAVDFCRNFLPARNVLGNLSSGCPNLLDRLPLPVLSHHPSPHVRFLTWGSSIFLQV